MPTEPPTLSPPTLAQSRRLARIFGRESVGGGVLLTATLIALILANSPLAGWYQEFRGTYFGLTIGEQSFRLTTAHWAADGLLAVFFFVVGLELKRELVVGDLRSPSRSLVPIAAAFGGVVVPALVYLLFTLPADGDAMQGWAIPSATDIAFALAVFALVGRNLPSALRLFLLTLAVVDDLIAITIIAVFYTQGLRIEYLLAAAVPLAAYGLLVQRGQRLFLRRPLAAWALLLPIGVICWGLMLESGVHATIAGVLLAFTVPAKPGPGMSGHGLAEIFEERFRPLSSGIAVPTFALFAAGVSFAGLDGGLGALTSPVALGIAVGLVAGKAIGITAATWLVTRLRGTDLDPALDWADIAAVATLAGIGFTVSLLITELSFEPGGVTETAKAAVLTGSAIAAVLGGVALAIRGRRRPLADVGT